jgi:hypothetical protein
LFRLPPYDHGPDIDKGYINCCKNVEIYLLANKEVNVIVVEIVHIENKEILVIFEIEVNNHSEKYQNT